MDEKMKGGSKIVKLGVIGAAVAGLAAAYFFWGPKGKQNRAYAKAWAIKMKGDVVEKLEKARDVSESVYHEIVDSVADEYEKSKRAGSKEIHALASDLKKHWKSISRSVSGVKRGVAKGAARAAREAGL